MRSFSLAIISGCFIFNSINAQNTESEKTLRTAQQADTLLGWKRGGVINTGLSQTSLTNWAAGGQNSVAINGLLSLYAHKKMMKSLWENYLDLGYGVIKQGNNTNWWKTDDKIDFTSKYGKATKTKWYYAGLLNFKSQMAQGFNYPNDSVKISNFLAPGYVLAAIGMEYKTEDFSLFVAPITDKTTIVLDPSLANAGAFGVDKAVTDPVTGQIITKGANVRYEFGGYVRMMYKKNLMENVSFQTELNLFSNYLENPENVDIFWNTLISLKVNKFISATVSTNLIYDDDIKISIDKNNDGIIDEKGPRVQFKEILSVGFSYKF